MLLKILIILFLGVLLIGLIYLFADSIGSAVLNFIKYLGGKENE